MKKDDTVPVKNDPGQKDPDAVWDAQWNIVSGLLRAEIGEAAYQSWLKPMTLRGIADGEVRISVPTRFMRDWIVAHYTDRLSELWAAENADVQGVDVFIQSDRETPSAGPAGRSSGSPAQAPKGDNGRSVADIKVTNQDGELVAVGQHILKWVPND